jgi:integrase/recombinase XerD
MRGLIHEYLDHAKRRGSRDKTMKDQQKRIMVFLEFVEEFYPDVKSVTDVTRDMVRAYEKHLVSAKDGRGKVMSRERRYRYLSTIKDFFAFLQKEEKIFKNPASNIALPRLRVPIVKDILTVEEMDTLLKSVPGDSFVNLRDRAILELLYSTGIRSDELCNIEVKDIDFNENLLYVRKGKLDRERMIPFGQSAHYWLASYLEKARPFMEGAGTEILFTSMTGTKLRPPVLVKIIKRRVRLAGIEKNVTTHTFRHTCATHMLKGRADIRYVQKQLGHTSIQTTEKYLKIEIRDLKEVHERCHPREQEDW